MREGRNSAKLRCLDHSKATPRLRAMAKALVFQLSRGTRVPLKAFVFEGQAADEG